MEHAKQYNKTAIRLENRALRMLLTTLRAKQTRQPAFVAAADRLCAILAEEALALLPDVRDDVVASEMLLGPGVPSKARVASLVRRVATRNHIYDIRWRL